MTEIHAIIVFLPAVFNGILLIHFLWQEDDDISLIIKVGLGVGVGLGVSSLFYFIVLLTSLPSSLFIFVQLIFALALALLNFVNGRFFVFKNWKLPPRSSFLQFGLFFAFLLITFASFVNYGIRRDQGAFDAWMIYNRAARFIYRDTENWQATLSPDLYWGFHPEYPLLLSLNTSSAWSVLGYENLRVPLVMSGLFLFASIGLLFFSLLKTKGVNFALMASIVLMSTPGFVRSGSGQTADVPFSFFMLATMVLLFLAEGSTKPNALTSMAGLTAGFAGWTKNEGQLLIVVSLFALLLDAFHEKKISRIKFYIAGMLLPGIAIFVLKLMSPKGDLFPSSIGQIYSQILDPYRYATILKSLSSGMFFLGEWPVPVLLFLLVFAMLSGLKKPASLVLPLILALQLIGYLGVYLITPHDLDWQLGTAFDRNLLQLFPSFLFLLFAYTESPNASHN